MWKAIRIPLQDIKLFVSGTEVQESLAVAAYNRSKGARSEGYLPGIVFSKALP
ncbi:MAG: hypothetical protein RL077_5787 [Verrucomicrobiota bacterium]